MTTNVTRLSLEAWQALARERYGDDPMKWRFVCPSCGHVAAVEDWKNAGASPGAVAFSCIGRFVGDPMAAADAAFRNEGGPCNYTSGGLLCINKVILEIDGVECPAFEVAPREEGVADTETARG